MEALAERADTMMCFACGLALDVPVTPPAPPQVPAPLPDPAASIAALATQSSPADDGPPPPAWAADVPAADEPAAAAPAAEPPDADAPTDAVAPPPPPSTPVLPDAPLVPVADELATPLGPPSRCPHCGAPTAMAPAVPVTDTSVHVGFIGSGRGARAAIAVADGTGGISLVTEDGIIRRTSPRHLRHFAAMRGLGSLTSPTAAALVCLEHLAIPALAASSSARRALLDHAVNGDVVKARRVASDLSAAGVAGPIAELPLTPAERNWWCALAELRVQRFDQAITHLAALPLGAYPPAVGLLVLCTGAPISAVSRRARTVLEQRLLAVDPESPLAGAATVSGRRTAMIDWLVHPDPFDAVAALRSDFDSSALRVLQALAGRVDPDEQIVLPASARPSVIDDLVDRGCRLADESLRGLPAERVVYLGARMRPEALSDADVDDLDFEEEHDRRLLHSGRIPDPTPERPDTPLIAAIRELVVHHRASDALRARLGTSADSLAALLDRPAAEHLTDRIAEDESLWVLLERAIGDDALTWEPASSGASRHFLAWFALRITQRRLWNDDLHGAQSSAARAIELSDPGPVRMEAINMLACAQWMVGKEQMARETLSAAIGAIRTESTATLEDNLRLVERDITITNRRQPHLVLGIASGVERSVAERAFAARSRLARRDPDHPFDVDALMWALAQVEAAIDDPEGADQIFALPLDRSVLQPPPGEGLLRPGVVPLARRTPPTSDADVAALVAEARSDALLHVLKGAGAQSRRSLGAGRDAPPPRPVPLSEYPRQRTSRLPQYLAALVVLGGAAAVTAFVLQRRDDEEQPVATTVVTTAPPPIETVPPTEAPTTTTEPDLPGVDDAIVVNGTSITPTALVNSSDDLCVLFVVTGDGPLGFVPNELRLVFGARTALPDLEITTGRATSEPVFGETGVVQREVCFPAPDWEQSTTDLVYRVEGDELRWRLNEPA